MTDKKLLVLDIETSPNLVYTWGLWKQDIAISQIVTPGTVLCWAARFYGEKKMHWAGLPDGKELMLHRAAQLLDDADVVIHFNGTSFDIPWLQGQFVEAEIPRPSPYAEVDLLKVSRSGFYLPSQKLEYLARAFKIGAKVKHEGFPLWTACMQGDPRAWARMKKYNIGDVVLTEQLYDRLRPWIVDHPHLGSPGTLECPRCGGTRVQQRGTYHAKTRSYQRYQCQGCGSWFRNVRSDRPLSHITTPI